MGFVDGVIIPNNGGGGSGSLTVTDEGSTVSGAVNELVFPTGTASIDGSSGHVRALPNNGANFDAVSIPDDLVMALTMNESASPIRDLSRLDGYLTAQGGTPLYGETGYFPSGTAIKLGRSNGCLFKYSNALLAPTTSTIGDGHTLSFVAKPVDKTAGNNGYYFSFYNGTNDRYYLFTDTTNIRLVDINGGSQLSANIDFADLETAPYNIDIFDGSFHLFTCVREHDGTGRSLKFFIDGQLVADNNDAQPLENYGLNTSQFGICGYIGAASAAAVLTVDEFVMSSSPWTGAMVSEHWNGGDILSFSTTGSVSYGFLESGISDKNSFLYHGWLLGEAGNTAVDSIGGTALTTNGSGVTREVTGRWPGTFATEIAKTANTRFSRLNSFNGPDSDTPWAINCDIQFLDKKSLNNSNGAGIIELGTNSSGTTRAAIASNFSGTLIFYNGHTASLISIDISSMFNDGLWHTVTFGHRYVLGVKEVFLAIDGTITTAVSSWSDLSDENLDVAIGETIIFDSYSANQPQNMRIQNVVMWNNVSLEDSDITALDGAQLVAIS